MPLILLLIGFATVWLWPDPMFHIRRELEMAINILPTLQPTLPVSDESGAIGFVDFRVNMFVVVVTGDRDAVCFSNNIRASTSTATLMAGSPYEVTVRAEENTLMVIQGGNCFRFPLENGGAGEIHTHICHQYWDHKWTLLEEVANAYDGSEKIALRRLAAELTGRHN